MAAREVFLRWAACARCQVWQLAINAAEISRSRYCRQPVRLFRAQCACWHAGIPAPGSGAPLPLWHLAAAGLHLGPCALHKAFPDSNA